MSASAEQPGLVAHELRLARGGREILRGASVTVPKGAVTVLVAPSGAGKSTLLRCLNRLLEPQAGTILLDGADVATLEPCALRRRVGLLAQRPTMLPGSVRENLAYALPQLPEPVLAKALHDAGLDASYAERTADALSGGEQARVGLARALTRAPELLLLDEPSAWLDAATARQLAATLRALVAAGLGILLATHDRAFAAATADRVVTLADGRIHDGTTASLHEAAP